MIKFHFSNLCFQHTYYLLKQKGWPVLSQNSDHTKMSKTVFYVLKKILSEIVFLNQSVIVYVVLTPTISSGLLLPKRNSFKLLKILNKTTKLAER